MSSAVYVDSIAPSVFAQRILMAWDYSFLDDGERANRRSRTVMTNRSIAEDAFRNEDLSSMLAAEAVESVVAEVTGRASGRKPRSRDELFELIRAHGSLTVAEVEERVGEGARAMIAELDAEGRLTRVSAGEILLKKSLPARTRRFSAAYAGASSDGDAAASNLCGER